jgi:hypothetical protein
MYSRHLSLSPGVVTVVLLLIVVGSVLSSSMLPRPSFVLAVGEEAILPRTAWSTCKPIMGLEKIPVVYSGYSIKFDKTVLSWYCQYLNLAI